MNWYKFHIGDYRKKTGHLSHLEHYIYRSLIDTYYDDEKPLSLDINRHAKLLCLNTEEVLMLEGILSFFFTKTDEGYEHSRPEREIANYHANLVNKKKAGMASGKARRTYGEDRTGVQQVFNKRSTGVEQERTGVEQVLNTKATDVEQKRDSVERTKNQEPRTTNHSSSELEVQNTIDDEVIKIPTNKNSTRGEFYVVHESQVLEWQKTYPDVDIKKQLQRIKSWNIDNPTRRKTHKGMGRHINAWLLNKQEKGEPNAEAIQASSSSSGSESKSDKFWKRTRSNINDSVE